MKFTKVETIDWYDNVLKSFCIDDYNIIYYCCILAHNEKTDQKVYLCVDIKYLLGCDKLKKIIDANSFKENWDNLSELIKLNNRNITYLIKTKNILIDDVELIKYEDDINLPDEVIWGEYPECLDEAAKIDNWWMYV